MPWRIALYEIVMMLIYIVPVILFKYDFLAVASIFEMYISKTHKGKTIALLIFEIAVFFSGSYFAYYIFDDFLHGGPIILCTIINIRILKKTKVNKLYHLNNSSPEVPLVKGCSCCVLGLLMIVITLALAWIAINFIVHGLVVFIEQLPSIYKQIVYNVHDDFLFL